jgi:hypothetical protein
MVGTSVAAALSISIPVDDAVAVGDGMAMAIGRSVVSFMAASFSFAPPLPPPPKLVVAVKMCKLSVCL